MFLKRQFNILIQKLGLFTKRSLLKKGRGARVKNDVSEIKFVTVLRIIRDDYITHFCVGILS